MNNKGVTLIELLIVIVVLGIISAFAIPAVGSIIENTERGAVYNDALQVENAARVFCQENATIDICDGSANNTLYVDDADITTGTTQETYGGLEDYIDSFDVSAYDDMVAVYNGSVWVVELDVHTSGTSDYEWTGTSDAPSNLDRSSVSDADSTDD